MTASYAPPGTPVVPVADRGPQPFAGTGPLFRLALRQDRVMIPAWVLVLGMVVVGGVGSLESLYDTPAKRSDIFDSLLTNGSLRALTGPAFDDSLGGLVAWRFGMFTATMAGLMSLLIVVRHTREEEETGRQEMLSSMAVGRRASLTAALLTALVANTSLALLVVVATAGPTGSASGALALGLTVGTVGMLFAGAAGITAQLTESARLARGLAGAVLGLAFALRAAGDSAEAAGNSVLTWVSPLGWASQVRPFAGERWWLLLLLAAAVVVQGLVAYVLAGRRDVGMSFLATRPGPAVGRLTTATGLAWRLQRGTFLAWTLAFLALGIVFGGMADGASDLIGENEDTRQIIERLGGQTGMTDAFLAAMVGMLGMVAAVYVVSAVLRLHGEETSQRAEPILANAVSRTGWAFGHLLIAFGGAAVVLAVGGLGLAIGHGESFGSVLGGALVLIPAVWLLGAIAVLVYGLLPRFATAAWALAGLCLAIGWIGPALDLPDAVLDLSPYAHLPKMPGSAMSWPPVLVLTALAAVMVGAGLAGLRRRDIETT
ncbi:ABC transporter permease [Streptomyces sp. NPDC020412]|uniref:ABC transporter permease n=1 Tax=Streptomyces sp. NPDC020412 TaxID=3365073 RepID=UPI0037977317